LYKSIIPLYLICFGCYILFTRQPDYFDGDFAPAKLVVQKDRVTGRPINFAEFSNGIKTFQVKADYPFRLFEHKGVYSVIFEKEHPEKAVIYKFWGYWIGWGELLGSIVFLLLSFQLAKAITMNPTPEALIEQLEYKEPSKPKYD
jgi:hypothetical protein